MNNLMRSVYESILDYISIRRESLVREEEGLHESLGPNDEDSLCSREYDRVAKNLDRLRKTEQNLSSKLGVEENAN